MKAAVVRDFARAPKCEEVDGPSAPAEGKSVVDVIAAGLHPRVRSQANGSHYTSTGVLPMIPGMDGVGRTAEGGLRYFVLADDVPGSMAERTTIENRRSVEIPAGADPYVVAAATNPAMSSWIALRRRMTFSPGMNVLVLGATGNAGSLAVRVARRFGAGRVIAAGRDPVRLEAVGESADATVSLTGGAGRVADRLAAAAADVDVVLDYLWGEPAAAAMVAMITARARREVPLRWIQIGAVAGATAPIPSAALRASGLEIVGSGQGSVTPAGIVEELPGLVEAIAAGDLGVTAKPYALADVERAWAEPADSTARTVIVPQRR